MNPDLDPLQSAAAFREVAAALVSKIREDPGVILARIPRKRVALRRLVHDLASGARDEDLEILFGLAARRIGTSRGSGRSLPPAPPAGFQTPGAS